MTSFLEDLIRLTIRLECADDTGRKWTGTGFMFSLLETKTESFPVIVTNRHVTNGANLVTLYFSVGDSLGRRLPDRMVAATIKNFETSWFPHPDPAIDLAVIPIGKILEELGSNDRPVLTSKIGLSSVLSERGLQTLDAVEEITMIGYPNGLWDYLNNVPLVRRGATATPIYLEHCGKPDFVIDLACFPGSSGSPVFIINRGPFVDKIGNLYHGRRCILVGVLHSGPHTETAGVVIDKDTGRSSHFSVLQMMHLGYCVRASKIMDFESFFIEKGLPIPTGFVHRKLRDDWREGNSWEENGPV